MGLDYLKQNPMSGFDDAVSNPAPKRSGCKFPKGKFSVLLGGSLIAWAILLVSVFDLNVFSMNSISVPHIPQKLSVSGIVYSEMSPSVIISNEVYGIGDVVDDYTVTRIARTEVEFQKGDKKIIRQVR
ncbi:MAG: hypothetical protein OEV87_10095 [Phycisphaerae bacterium]|nr:hypothetical protein [Phycisphaerae bacterium]